MANSELTQALKQNWYLLAACAVLVVGGIVYGLTQGGDSGTDEGALVSEETEFQDLNADSPAGVSANENFVKRTGTSNAKGKEGQKLEKEYLAKLQDASLSDDEYALTLFRLANVYYSALDDYDSAITYFEELIDGYPNYVRTKDAWKYLADCHNRNGDFDQEIAVYNQMITKFPEDSDLNKWAREQLQ